MLITTKINDKLRNFEDYVDVQITQHNGVVISEYKMTLSDYISSLIDATENEARKIETPILPHNCIKHVSFPSLGEHHVYVEVLKQQWDIQFQEGQFKVGFPRLIFKWIVKDSSVSLDKIVAIKKGRIDSDTNLFHFPYSHVEHESGSVCMGGNTFPEIDSLTKLETMHSLFFHSPFSTDYGADTKLNKQVWELFSDTFNEKEFDDDCLVSYEKTLNQFFGFESEQKQTNEKRSEAQ